MAENSIYLSLWKKGCFCVSCYDKTQTNKKVQHSALIIRDLMGQQASLDFRTKIRLYLYFSTLSSKRCLEQIVLSIFWKCSCFKLLLSRSNEKKNRHCKFSLNIKIFFVGWTFFLWSLLNMLFVASSFFNEKNSCFLNSFLPCGSHINLHDLTRSFAWPQNILIEIKTKT